VFCYDAALLRQGGIGRPPDFIHPLEDLPPLRESPRNLRVAGQTFEYVETLPIEQAEDMLKVLRPRDLLMYYSQGHSGAYHANRFLGFRRGGPVFLDKWGTSPLKLRSWQRLRRFPTAATRARPHNPIDNIAHIKVYRPLYQ
jgi:hypothetical protein